MSERRDQDFLRDILEAIQRVGEYTAGMSVGQFMADRKTQDAVVRNLEVIGEAAKKLSDELRAAQANLPWKDLADVRDKLIHHYFGINHETVWTIARDELPGLLPQIEAVLAQLGE